MSKHPSFSLDRRSNIKISIFNNFYVLIYSMPRFAYPSQAFILLGVFLQINKAVKYGVSILGDSTSNEKWVVYILHFLKSKVEQTLI
jgi:hypothetical protein